MSQQRMAGSQGFKQGMQNASKPRGGSAGGPKLIGADAWDRQVGRESAQFNNAAVSGSRGAENIAAYANVSKSATQANGNFSQNSANKWVNNARTQGDTTRKANEGFSDARVQGNTNFADQQQDKAFNKNEGFSMNTTNNFVNNAKNHREDNTAKATAFADRTVDKYIAKNKANQAINVGGLDQQVRSAPIVDQSYSKLQGLNTYGDMYSYGRKELPTFKMPTPMGPSKDANIQSTYNTARKDIKDTKL